MVGFAINLVQWSSGHGKPFPHEQQQNDKINRKPELPGRTRGTNDLHHHHQDQAAHDTSRAGITSTSWDGSPCLLDTDTAHLLWTPADEFKVQVRVPGCTSRRMFLELSHAKKSKL